MENNKLEIEFFGGKIEYYKDSSGEAVLTDYKGDGRVLYIPKDLSELLDKDSDPIPVAGYIPDESFGSPENIEAVIFAENMRLGTLLFTKCRNLSAIIAVDSEIEREEFTFVGENYVPRSVVEYELISESYSQVELDEYSYDLLAIDSAVRELLIGYARRGDSTRLIELAALGNIGDAISEAIAKDDVDTLLHIESLGVAISPDSPFIISASAAIKCKSYRTLDLLLERGVMTVGYADGSLLYVAVVSGDAEIVKKVLAAGAPVGRISPEWDNSRPVIQVARELGNEEIYALLLEASQ